MVMGQAVLVLELVVGGVESEVVSHHRQVVERLEQVDPNASELRRQLGSELGELGVVSVRRHSEVVGRELVTRGPEFAQIGLAHSFSLRVDNSMQRRAYKPGSRFRWSSSAERCRRNALPRHGQIVAARRCRGTTIEGARCRRSTVEPSGLCGLCRGDEIGVEQTATPAPLDLSNGLAPISDILSGTSSRPIPADAIAMRASVTARAKAAAAAEPTWDQTERLRQFAYQRLIARCFASEPDRWVLKGAQALLARMPNARHSADVDFWLRGDGADPIAALKKAAEVDLGDFFTFEVQATGKSPRRVKALVRAYLGRSMFCAFSVDLNTTSRPTAEIEEVVARSPIGDGLVDPVVCRVYPMVDHLADKCVAAFGSYGPEGMTSTRHRDLVDVVLVTGQQSIEARPARIAIVTRFAELEVAVPAEFDVPDHKAFEVGWNKLTRRHPILSGMRFAEGLRRAKMFYDPLLSDKAEGWYDPKALSWGCEAPESSAA